MQSSDKDSAKKVCVVEMISLNEHAKMGYLTKKPQKAILAYKKDGDYFDYATDVWIQDYMIKNVLKLDAGKEKYPEVFL